MGLKPLSVLFNVSSLIKKSQQLFLLDLVGTKVGLSWNTFIKIIPKVLPSRCREVRALRRELRDKPSSWPFQIS